MKITIEAESKEIADLVLNLQNRQSAEKTVEVELYPKKLSSTRVEAIRGMCEASSTKSAHTE